MSRSSPELLLPAALRKTSRRALQSASRYRLDDEGDKLTYTLGGTNAASFDIDAASGQLQTKAALDYETKSSYSVTVTATDPSGASDTITVTITVTNVGDDEGKVTLSSTQPQVGTQLTATLTDPDGVSGQPTWQWASADSAGGSFIPINGATSATFTPGTRTWGNT